MDIYNNKNKQTKLLYEPDNRFQPAEERICKLEDKKIEDTKSEGKKNEGKARSGLMRHHQTDWSKYYGSYRRRERMRQKTVWRIIDITYQIGWKSWIYKSKPCNKF